MSVLKLRNVLFDTHPIVVHAHGPHQTKMQWPQVRDAFFASEPRTLGAAPGLTLITCNNGHEAMGLLERSLDHLGLPYLVGGVGVDPWVNSRDKPRVILDLLARVETRHVLYADSRDAILVDDPRIGLERFRQMSSCRLLFGADRLNWPNVKVFKQFEESLDGSDNAGKFRYLNGGVWLGEREFSLRFFERALATTPVPEAADSEQGLLKKLFPSFYPDVQLDYRCRIIQNLGFVTSPIMELA
ncbi:MAG: hypothetical protein HY815_01145 [Candidatus Riflebacteria bacterium]|nr:hypothetical protein [Candidatus Riflebacteria bacterium]